MATGTETRASLGDDSLDALVEYWLVDDPDCVWTSHSCRRLSVRGELTRMGPNVVLKYRKSKLDRFLTFEIAKFSRNGIYGIMLIFMAYRNLEILIGKCSLKFLDY